MKSERIKSVDLAAQGQLDENIVQIIPDEIALKHKVICFDQDEDHIYFATANPFNIYTQDAVRELTHAKPVFCFTPATQIEESLRKYYLHDDEWLDEYDALSDDDENDPDNLAAQESEGEEGPAVRHVNNILLNAIQERASDIHIEPHEDKLKILYRVDGVLHHASTYSKKLSPSTVSRVKILSALDIAERRLPKDGRTRITIFGRDIDLRVSTLPTINGEKIVLRILDKDLHSLNISDIGLQT